MEIRDLKKPPKNINTKISPERIARDLSKLIGVEFKLTGKSRTDGSNIRKIISNLLIKNIKPVLAIDDTYQILQKKGLPKLLAYCIDTYIVTSDENYNLQVWNRFPNSENPLIKYNNSDLILSKDIFFLFVKIKNSLIDSIIITSPKYIEDKFGNFGITTIKHQLIISESVRKKINDLKPSILFENDTLAIQKIALRNKIKIQKVSIKEEPIKEDLYQLDVIRDTLSSRMIGMQLPELQTKNKGQLVEKEVIQLLGYNPEIDILMEGNYPDLRHQLLEIKVQDSPTVDLGKFSPILKTKGFTNLNVSTEDVRYFIALVDRKTKKITSLVIMPGKEFSKHFSDVPETSFKCQKGIPIDFFNKYSGKSIYLK